MGDNWIAGLCPGWPSRDDIIIAQVPVIKILLQHVIVPVLIKLHILPVEIHVGLVSVLTSDQCYLR